MLPIHHSQTVTAWLPIRSTAMGGHEPNHHVVDECINAFTSSLSTVLPFLIPEISEVKVTETCASPEVMTWLSRNSSLVSTKLFRIYSVSAIVTFVDNLNRPEPGDDLRFLSAIAADFLEKAISCSLHLGELAYPGAIYSREGVVVDDIGMLSAIAGKYSLSCAGPYSSDLTGWPTLKILDLRHVAAWAKGIGFTTSGFATTRIQRTLAAFTHVVGLGWSKDGEVLFRAMQGLEAFYCDGIGDLRRQLAHKSAVWLGPTLDRANVVGRLYDQRSKFIHGSSKMLYWQNFVDPEQEDGKTMEQFSDAVDFATKLLLASLQECVTRQVADVSWSYACTAKPLSP